MSLTSEARIRQEGNLPDSIKDNKIQASIENAVIEVEKIIDSLTKLVIDYSFLDTSDFDIDGQETTYRFSYSQFDAFASGWDKEADTNYVALILKINTALTGNGEDALNDNQKLLLRRAGRDFRKAETLIALSYFALTGGLRPTNDGGFIKTIMMGAGQTTITDWDDVVKISNEFRKRAKEIIGQYLASTSVFMDYIDASGLSISAIPPRSHVQTIYTNPREKYVGDPDQV
jgi:hypothetical protein